MVRMPAAQASLYSFFLRGAYFQSLRRKLQAAEAGSPKRFQCPHFLLLDSVVRGIASSPVETVICRCDGIAQPS
jgi:hypothetical protein